MSALHHAVALALLLVLASAGTSRAVGVGNPFQSVADCGNPDIAAHMGATDPFVKSARCASLCKKAVSDCKKLTKRINACLASYYTTFYSWQDRSCDELLDAADRRSCKLEDAHDLKTTKSALIAAQESESGDCDSWGASCAGSCAP